MKKYIAPSLQVVKINNTDMLCTSPGLSENPYSGPQYSRGNRGNLTDWDDDED